MCCTNLISCLHWVDYWPPGGQVIALRCQNKDGVVGGLLASLNTGTNTGGGHWKCKKTSSPGWQGVVFDDSSWAPPYVIGPNGNTPTAGGTDYWGKIDNIGTFAYFVFTSKWQGTNQDTSLFCRLGRLYTNSGNYKD